MPARSAHAAVLALLALLAAGCGAKQPESRVPGAAATRAALQGAPAPLARLHREANRLLPGGRSAFEARLAGLRGHPVVINKWASWCGPCRFEFPFFQSQSVKLGREVAFVGLNSGDNRGDARAFLRRFPVTYPSYEDPDEKIARAIGAPANYPITLFYDSRGKRVFIHQGAYSTEAKLAEDIRRYALGDS